MDLKGAKLGDVYKVFINDSRELADEPTMKTMTGTIIAKKKPTAGSGFIFGWRKNQERPSNAFSRSNTSLEHDYVADQATYVFGKSVTANWAVASKVLNGIDGMACQRCRNFYTYAVPNQTDG